MINSNRYRFLVAVMAAGALAGCNSEPAPQTDQQLQTDTATEEPRSIFRPEFQAEAAAEPETLAPLDVSIGFPEGSALTAAAEAELSGLLQSPEFAAGGPVVLRGHSDAGGSDGANMRASQARAEVVQKWLVGKGVSSERISVIAFGEQNPVAPNALPDGSPNEAGRAKNRRVDVHVGTGTAAAPEPAKEPTLAETLSEPPPESEAPTAP